MSIDLHTHTLASDGTVTPRELLFLARGVGLDVVAITDHDNAAGWDEATGAAHEVGVELVLGMEISTRYGPSEGSAGVHLLAYLPDPTYPPLVAELQRILGGRGNRVPGMIAKLRAEGIDIHEHDIDAPVPGRPHVADALVRKKVVRSRDEAFAKYLSPGMPGYVDRYAAPLTEMIGLVRAAGGAPVIAHPWGRGRSDILPPEELAKLTELGLVGIEVDHQDHEAGVRDELRGLAGELGLLATGSSDFHGAGKVNHDLGCNTTAPEVYEALLARCTELASASDASPPEVVRPG